MKKKFFAIYALIGAMAASPIFTSCVESEETPSVEALRNAKAEELKAIADLNNAKAASATALAAADAALLNAQAEAVKAQKKLTEANAAYLETQNEKEKADNTECCVLFGFIRIHRCICTPRSPQPHRLPLQW